MFGESGVGIAKMIFCAWRVLLPDHFGSGEPPFLKLFGFYVLVLVLSAIMS